MVEADARAANQTRLKSFIEAQNETLLKTLRLYSYRAGLASTEYGVATAAAEVLNEMVVEALEHAERFDPSRQPIAWLLGIAANLIRRRQAELGKRSRREPLARDMAGEAANTLSDDDLFDKVAPLVGAGPDVEIEQNEMLTGLLARVSHEDQRVLRLAVAHDFDGAALARELGLRPGAARVRLHRALGRVREAALAGGWQA